MHQKLPHAALELHWLMMLDQCAGQGAGFHLACCADTIHGMLCSGDFAFANDGLVVACTSLDSCVNA